jgi:hypothetical protein
VWHADGHVAELAAGRPLPVGISDDGTVLTNAGAEWNAGQAITLDPTATALILTYGGRSARLNDYPGYPVVWVQFAPSKSKSFSVARSTVAIGLNDAGDVWLRRRRSSSTIGGGISHRRSS